MHHLLPEIRSEGVAVEVKFLKNPESQPAS